MCIYLSFNKITLYYYLDKVSGGIDDYAYEKLKFPYAYTCELPDKGNQGFVLDPKHIRPVAAETHDGMCAYYTQIATRHNLTVHPSTAQMEKIKLAKAESQRSEANNADGVVAADDAARKQQEQRQQQAQKKKRTSSKKIKNMQL